MNYSENYGFALPEDNDFYDIAPISENFDAVDGILAENNAAMQEISEKVGTPAENGSTLFSLLENNSGGSVIRSIQYKTLDYINTTGSYDISIAAVDLAKTFIILERLYCSSDSLEEVAYTLTTNNIHVETPFSSGRLGFWIIEFN